ncbi:MAG: phage holin family protein [Anaerolineae bacterium]|nr:phage holin family protein [Anaerolineae bacterium]MDH7474924.1 phage holin family protein [Anaerolineae bacterium]
MLQRIALRWLINGLAIFAAAQIVPGIHTENGWTVIAVMAVILGLANALIAPVLKFLTCPLIILTLGLFTLVINAVVFWFSAWVGESLGLGFYVDNFWAAFLGALVVSVVSMALSLVIGENGRKRK